MVFIGRAEELARLRRALADDSRVVLVAGEVGIGKTRLVTEFTASLDARVVVGACLELGAEGLPYAPFVAVIRRLARDSETPGRALAHWLPELGEPAGGRTRLFEEVLALIESAAPVVVVLEDLHWADRSSRELLTFLVRNLGAPGVLLVGTYRPEDLDEDLRGLLASIARAGVLVEPAPLTRAEVAELLADPARAADIHRRSGGNPLFAEALADAGARTPAPLRDLLLDGVRALPDDTRQVLSIASAAGGPVDSGLLAAAASRTEADLEDALRPALARRLVVVDDEGRYAFRHSLYRAALYESLLPGERTRIHAAYAEVVTSPAELAAHWQAAGDRASALDAAWLAASAASAVLAPAGRLAMLERVLELWAPGAEERIGRDRIGVVGEAARAALDAGEAERGLALADEALAAGPTAELLELRSLLNHRLGRDGLDDLRAALALNPEGDLRGRILAALANRTYLLFRDVKAAEMADEALRVGGPAARAVALATLASIATRNGEPAEGVRLATEALAAAETAEDPDNSLLALVVLAIAHKAAGAHAVAAEVAGRGVALARRAGLERGRGAVLAGVRADSLIQLGRWAEAERLLTETLELDPPPLYRAILLTALATVQVLTGDLIPAEAAVREAAGPLERYPGCEFRLPLEEVRCRLALATGDLATVAQVADRLAAEPEALANPALVWPLLTLTLPYLPDGPTRMALHDLATNLPATTPAEHAHRTALTPAARADQAGAPAGVGGWAGAVAAWRGLGQPYQLAEVVTRAAEAALAAGERGAAREWVAEARAIAEGLGAAPLLADLGALAVRGGFTETETTAHGLTGRELEVLRLVTLGHSNRQIGEELFISAKTAGVHVSNILAKLGVTSRTEAAAVAHRERLFPG